MLGSKLFEYKKPLNFLQLPQVSQACQRDFLHYLTSLMRMEFWALQSKWEESCCILNVFVFAL